jgi:transaldolase
MSTTVNGRPLQVKIFADGADLRGMIEMTRNPHVSGFTTNPTLMHKAGVRDYEAFAREILAHVTDKPISFEVFADDEREIERQANRIAGWGTNVFVKIPVTTTQGRPLTALVARLAKAGVQQNVTALMTLAQVEAISDALGDMAPANVSVFAGRIADTGRDPMPIMKRAVEILARFPRQELIWASPRELLNIFQADAVGCQIITVANDVLAKLSLVDKDLDEYSLETVRMFHRDATTAGFRL